MNKIINNAQNQIIVAPSNAGLKKSFAKRSISSNTVNNASISEDDDSDNVGGFKF